MTGVLDWLEPKNSNVPHRPTNFDTHLANVYLAGIYLGGVYLDGVHLTHKRAPRIQVCT